MTDLLQYWRGYNREWVSSVHAVLVACNTFALPHDATHQRDFDNEIIVANKYGNIISHVASI